MADIKIAGIMRAGAFSPNHIGNDAAIFNLVAEQLRKRGCIVNIYSEDHFINSGVDEAVVLNMCREKASIERLEALEDAGRLVINSGYGIENCIRERMSRILMAAGIPYPESFIIDTDEVVRDRLAKAGFERCWVKRGESHTKHREDVTFARHPQEAQEILQEFFLRNIKRAVINRHIDGELLKFYGVAGTSFFFNFFPMRSGHTRFGEGPATDAPQQNKFDSEGLKALCVKAATAMDVEIYGGDCIVGPDGSITIIDFNDWPSFAPCRNEAAPVIARMVMNEIKKHRS